MNGGSSRWEPGTQAQSPRPCSIQGEVGGTARPRHRRWLPQRLTMRQIIQGLSGWEMSMKIRKKSRDALAAEDKRLWSRGQTEEVRARLFGQAVPVLGRLPQTNVAVVQ